MSSFGNSSLNARQQYDHDGFYIAKNLLPLPLLQACLHDIDQMLEDQLSACNLVIPAALFERALALHTMNIEQYKKLLAALWRLQSVSDVFAHPEIRRFLKEVIGFGKIFMPGGQTVHLQSEELKIPGGYFGLKAHQDWPSVQGSLDGVGVWVPLCDIDASSFPLEIVPGSHRRGLIEPLDGKTDIQWVVTDFDDAAYVPICVNKGDVVFFSNFAVHRSGANGKRNFVRLACSSRFDNGDESTYIRRGYPSAYTRGVHRQLMDFPDATKVNQLLAEGEDGK
jgi:ectoine hydroxylase-related dioxygenase (phytanoyl-CoA dioxygenase family)